MVVINRKSSKFDEMHNSSPSLARAIDRDNQHANNSLEIGIDVVRRPSKFAQLKITTYAAIAGYVRCEYEWCARSAADFSRTCISLEKTEKRLPLLLQRPPEAGHSCPRKSGCVRSWP